MNPTTLYMTDQSTDPAFRRIVIMRLLRLWCVWVFRKMCVAETVLFPSSDIHHFCTALRLYWSHHQCCVSILYIALSLLVQPLPWWHTKANTKQIVSVRVCASSVHFNIAYVLAKTHPILAFLLSSSCTVHHCSATSHHVSSTILMMNFTWQTFHASTMRSLWVEGASQRSQWESFALFWSNLHLHTYMRAPSVGWVSFLFPFISMTESFPWILLLHSSEQICPDSRSLIRRYWFYPDTK